MNAVVIEIVFIVLLLLANGLFAMSEIVIRAQPLRVGEVASCFHVRLVVKRHSRTGSFYGQAA